MGDHLCTCYFTEIFLVSIGSVFAIICEVKLCFHPGKWALTGGSSGSLFWLLQLINLLWELCISCQLYGQWFYWVWIHLSHDESSSFTWGKDTDLLYLKDYSDSLWFKACMSEDSLVSSSLQLTNPFLFCCCTQKGFYLCFEMKVMKMFSFSFTC